jgi:transcriptional regulator GlxA family with amidase domain
MCTPDGKPKSTFRDRVFGETNRVTVSDGDWTTSDAMMDLLREEGADAWRAAVDRQLTTEEVRDMTPEQMVEAQKAGKLDRLLAGG